MRRILSDPLLHFCFAGAALFGLHRLVGGDESATREGLQGEANSREVRVSVARAAKLFAAYKDQYGALPEGDAAQRLLFAAADSEILIREARRLGLDEHDPIIARRLGQKMRFVLEDASSIDEPTQQALQDFLDAHADEYARPETRSFVHVFFSGDSIDAPRVIAAGKALSAATRDEAAQLETSLGDPFGHGRQVVARNASEITRAFGSAFAKVVFSSEAGRWIPVASSYGAHWVRVDSVEASRPARLQEVEAQVAQAWRQERATLNFRREVEALRGQYQLQMPARESILRELESGQGSPSGAQIDASSTSQGVP